MFQSSTAQSIVTTVNVCVMLFIISVGGYLGFKSGWVGYELSNGYGCVCVCIIQLMMYSIPLIDIAENSFFTAISLME